MIEIHLELELMFSGLKDGMCQGDKWGVLRKRGVSIGRVGYVVRELGM